MLRMGDKVHSPPKTLPGFVYIESWKLNSPGQGAKRAHRAFHNNSGKTNARSTSESSQKCRETFPLTRPDLCILLLGHPLPRVGGTTPEDDTHTRKIGGTGRTRGVKLQADTLRRCTLP